MTGDACVLPCEFVTTQTIRPCISTSKGSLNALFSTNVNESCDPEDDLATTAGDCQTMLANDQTDEPTFNQ